MAMAVRVLLHMGLLLEADAVYLRLLDFLHHESENTP
jgi:hypothetical protein